jgi:uncharacterized protein YutE (UPF0331/DUF86 family)
MDAELQKRCQELTDRGKKYSSQIRYFRGSPGYSFSAELTADLQAWIASVANLFRIIATPDTYFHQECERILQDEYLRQGVPYHVVQKLVGLLESVLEEIQRGLLTKAEYIFVASTFDEFLDHAEEYHKAGRKIESSVLASAVFEDSLRKLATKSNVKESGVPLDTVIDELVKVNILTAVKAKRIKGYSAVRNRALHAQWNDFDLRDVGEMIKGTREILEML